MNIRYQEEIQEIDDVEDEYLQKNDSSSKIKQSKSINPIQLDYQVLTINNKS